MDWDDLLFLHWRVDPAVMRRLVPEEVGLDLFDGSAWIGLVPFRMANCAFRGVPRLASTTNFFECNVRTYAKFRGVAGVWFFSLDAQTLLPVLGGRWLWSLNYVYSRFDVTREETEAGVVTDYRLARRAGPWPRGQTRVRWRTGELISRGGEAGVSAELARFLTERYYLFTRRGGRILAGRVAHEPWPLRRAEVLELDDTLVRAAGVVVSGAPIAMASKHIEVEGFKLGAVGC